MNQTHCELTVWAFWHMLLVMQLCVPLFAYSGVRFLRCVWAVITTDYGKLYCTDRVEGAGRMGRERDNELISSSPTLILRWTCSAAWWHVVWKAISSVICVSLLPTAWVTVVTRIKVSFFWCCFYQVIHTYTLSALPVCWQNWLMGYKQHLIWSCWIQLFYIN